MNLNNLPKVVLAGRPNVGKSTLFNRLIRDRRAITDETPGVTRDPIEVVWNFGSGSAILIDTGGYQEAGNEIDQMVTRKTLQKAAEADLIILVLDVTELTQEDQEFISKLRSWSDKVLLAVNKVDSPLRESEVFNFHSLGFPHVVGISAVHGRGMEDFLSMVQKMVILDKNSEAEKNPDIRMAILGKPNAGKSTLVNYMTQQELSLVSSIPGTTRDVIEGRFMYKEKIIKVVDTAGIRRKKKVVEDVEYYSVNRAIRTIAESDVVVLLIDVEEGLSEQDKKIASLIVREGKGLILGVNKWDTTPKVGNQLQAVKDRINFFFPVVAFAPILPLSAKEGSGVDELLTTVVKQYHQLNKRVETAKLNQLLKAWLEDMPPSASRGKGVRVLYMTQVEANPVRFVAFVSNKAGVSGSYTQYLKNRIRKDLGFQLVPFELEIRDHQDKKTSR